MTSVEKGRFCTSCQKQVHDFTNVSDKEIKSILNNDKSACGRFRHDQLDRDLVIPKEKKSLWLWLAASAAIVSFIGVGTHEIVAQEPTNTEQHETNNEILGDIEVTPTSKDIITGVVSDHIGPLPTASIINKTTEQEVQTDIDGKFSVEANKGDRLEVNYIGYKIQNITINQNTNYNIVLEEDSALLGDVYIIKERTFFGRIFHWIGNIFR
ncbi:hypothetical protein DVK85_11435 [Flavobacterium arcticum]|uniref:Carboxypeptidase-like regulatory domain-containing protein n=1 Tax=Flavobacterium arcticum TaxID=1784713 RepID=A0A345HDZ8_9FLAO|nr:carboxypeptidase-like regulatory domain-containing protein [Flavobacterium arcticum]AXG74808.1 hypothetical protein DVK85_11435 [Flavobacterium arcticum]KAF2509694.1 hypothetical protein E0W72_09235 [Flavobacterium arcticum]